MKMNRVIAFAALTVFFSCSAYAQRTQPAAGSCEALAKVALPQAKITSAQFVAAGELAMPTPGNSAQAAAAAAFFKSLPAFCRVAVEASPSSDSDIKIEVWLPASGWNGKFQGQGNGGFAGTIDYRSMGIAIGQGYATASTDTGHSAAGGGPDASWALGHPEKIIDFGYRAIHLMTQFAKTLVNSYYGSNPQRSYFSSCSNGGRQALIEAQRYPEDYDGIIAGAPANFWTHLLTGSIWNAQALSLDPESYIPASKLAAISSAVNDACDKLDGVADGILNDPRECKFDPTVLLCKNGDADSCLTAKQITALKKIYEGAHDSHGRELFPGFLPGAELGGNGWPTWISGATPRTSLGFEFGTGFFGDMVFQKADWDMVHADLDQAVAAADEKMAGILNAVDPNLTSFKARGGKLIIYHGWNDSAIPALNTVNYYNSVIDKMGRQNTDSFVRVFMVPGMQHCGGGPGADNFGATISATPTDPQHSLELSLEQWVEKGAAPRTIIATKYGPNRAVTMTRPLCPYPQSAKYNGTGDPNSAASFVCATGPH
ncbi:MAG TPA: tannase/feruloyl esterase family alpha/beta hydrolase [Candidatus Acidoferrum sp.]|nr:tannase/feruloyl esterase family alpha/beta hydrolase [Candidatus Acidoferrum sp.]